MARSAIVVLLWLAAASSTVVETVRAQATGADSFIGTWRANHARSTFSPGPAPAEIQLAVRQFSALDGGWYQYVGAGVNAQGGPNFGVVRYRMDGQQYPVHQPNTLWRLLTAGQPTNMATNAGTNVMRSYRRIDARSVEYTTYTDGVATTPVVRTVAPDGMSYTETTRGTNAQGQAVNNVLVFDKVR